MKTQTWTRAVMFTLLSCLDSPSLFICSELLAENTIVTFIYLLFIRNSSCGYAQPGQFYTLDVVKRNSNPRERSEEPRGLCALQRNKTMKNQPLPDLLSAFQLWRALEGLSPHLSHLRNWWVQHWEIKTKCDERLSIREVRKMNFTILWWGEREIVLWGDAARWCLHWAQAVFFR